MAKQQTKIIFNLQYRYTQYTKKKLNSQQKKKQINTKEAFDYYDRDEACDKTISTKEAFDYYDYRLGSEGGFDVNGAIGSETCQNLCDKYQPEIIYRGVVSFDKQFTIENGIIEKAQMEKLIRKSMNSILTRLQLEPDNVIWNAFYHTNTEHPHCHITFYEKQRTRKLDRYPKKQLERVRSEIVSLLQVNTQLYIKKDESFNSLINSISELESSLKKGLMYTGNNSQQFKSRRSLINKICDLEKKLPKEGSMKYNSKNIRPYHNEIREILKEMFDDEEIRPFYKEYKKVLDELKQSQISLYGTGDTLYDDTEGNTVHGVGKGKKDIDEYHRKRLYQLETRVANMLLQNIVKAREDIDEYKIKTSNKPPTLLKVKHTDGNIRQKDIEPIPTYKAKEDKKKHKNSNSHKPIPAQRKMYKNFKTRTKIMKSGLIRELSRDIQEMKYSLSHEQFKVEEVTRQAQQEIYQRY